MRAKGGKGAGVLQQVFALVEQLRRVHRAGAQEYVTGRDGSGFSWFRRLAVGAVAKDQLVVVHDELLAIVLDGGHLRHGADVAAAVLVLGTRQVVEIERVLRLVVASSPAASAHIAGVLDSSEAVRSTEIHCQRCAKPGIGWIGRPLQLQGLGEPLRDRHGAQHVSDEIKIGAQRVPGVLRRPATLEHLIRGPEVDIRVDQRAAAVAGGLYREGAAEIPHVVNAVILAPQPPRKIRRRGEALLALADGGEQFVSRIRRKISRPVAATPFQHADIETCFDETTGGHGAGESGSDDDGVELLRDACSAPLPQSFERSSG